MSKFSNLKLRHKIGVGVATGAAVLGAAGGGAFAYWGSSGSGTGSASTDTAHSSLTYSNTTISGLGPGVAAATFTATVGNTGTQNSYVSSLSAYLTVTETASEIALWGDPSTSSAGSQGTYYCSSADYTLDGTAGTSSSSKQALNWTAQDINHGSQASNNGTDTVGFKDLPTTDQDACQGATVTIHYSSN
ncbi:MAG TPA: hypothetical protein VFZ97_11745 [Acidimicrobiales bacterium]